MGENTVNFEVSTPPTSEAVQRLSDALDSLERSGGPFPAALQIPAGKLNSWEWLQANPDNARIVWCDRGTDDQIAGIGIAAECVSTGREEIGVCLNECRSQLSGNPHLKWFGGFSFDGSDAWQSFGAAKFVIPRFTLSGGYLTLAVVNGEDIGRARLDLQALRLEGEAVGDALPTPFAREYFPTVNGWQSRIDEALTMIQREVVEKIVLSRKTVLRFRERLNPIVLSASLQRTTHDCFVFCFNFGGDSTFVGATPEQLFLRTGNTLKSEVVAGTRMRGDTAAEDERLAIELLTSDKDQREHDIVRKSIRQKLHQFIDHLDVDSQASILRLARKQHLRSTVQGELRPGVDDGQLLKRLHPTPAVGGYPTENALPEIARIEPFNRGWYAAPVGWIGADSAQFAVAIRSGLIESDTLSLFSGAGIVRGSDPDEEWQEVENKIQDFMSILGC
jgi:menaquinone-specific isochorismate synthase